MNHSEPASTAHLDHGPIIEQLWCPDCQKLVSVNLPLEPLYPLSLAWQLIPTPSLKGLYRALERHKDHLGTPLYTLTGTQRKRRHRPLRLSDIRTLRALLVREAKQKVFGGILGPEVQKFIDAPPRVEHIRTRGKGARTV